MLHLSLGNNGANFDSPKLAMVLMHLRVGNFFLSENLSNEACELAVTALGL
jgi:hypothetical protein